MLKIYTTIASRLVRDQKGASAVEYAIIVGGIALAITTAVTAFGTDLSGAFTGLGTRLTAATGS